MFPSWVRGVSWAQKVGVLWTELVETGSYPQKGVVLWMKLVETGSYPQKVVVLWTELGLRSKLSFPDLG